MLFRIKVIVSQVLESIVDSDHLEAIVDRFDGRCADDTVDTWCRTAADYDEIGRAHV